MYHDVSFERSIRFSYQYNVSIILPEKYFFIKYVWSINVHRCGIYIMGYVNFIKVSVFFHYHHIVIFTHTIQRYEVRALVISFDSATIRHNFNVKRMTYLVSKIENKPLNITNSIRYIIKYINLNYRSCKINVNEFEIAFNTLYMIQNISKPYSV